jgi:hypothetical protein
MAEVAARLHFEVTYRLHDAGAASPAYDLQKPAAMPIPFLSTLLDWPLKSDGPQRRRLMEDRAVSDGHFHPEEVFRRLLRLEMKRAQRSNATFLLVLVSLAPESEMRGRLSTGAARAVFSRLAGTVRDVDFVGWHRDGYVAGAVLAQRTQAPPLATRQEIQARVFEAVSTAMPVAPEHLRVRVRVVGGSPRC